MEHVKPPDFKLYDSMGALHQLSQYQGRWIFLFFYPKDETPGCIKEVCGIRDVYHNFIKEGIMVIGVSADDAQSHTNFINKYGLSFLLLCDPEGVVSKEYGAWGEHKFDGKTIYGVQRESFLINNEGVVVKHYKKVNPDNHANDVFEDYLKIKKI